MEINPTSNFLYRLFNRYNRQSFLRIRGHFCLFSWSICFVMRTLREAYDCGCGPLSSVLRCRCLCCLDGVLFLMGLTVGMSKVMSIAHQYILGFIQLTSFPYNPEWQTYSSAANSSNRRFLLPGYWPIQEHHQIERDKTLNLPPQPHLLQ